MENGEGKERNGERGRERMRRRKGKKWGEDN